VALKRDVAEKPADLARTIEAGRRAPPNWIDRDSIESMSADRKLFVILRVFASSWWIGSGLYHEDAKTQRIAKFLVAAGLLCDH